MSVTAIVLAGGRGSRLGGLDKASLTHGGVTLLDALLAALPTDWPVVVAGSPRSTQRSVRWAQEQRPFGGPVAGLAAALPLVDTAQVALIAVDMPHAAVLLPGLAAHEWRSPADIAISVDSEGRRQQLVCVANTAALVAAVAGIGEPYGAAMRDVQELMSVVEVPCGDDRLVVDIDTADDARVLLD